jgi:putative hydrolase of the HAD superfamily
MPPPGHGLRAISFDAAGTLFHPVRPVGTLYAEVATRHGVRVEATALHARFRRAFGGAPPLAFPSLPAVEVRARERAWWHAVVREVFRDIVVPDFDAYFTDLFATFARPDTWHLDPAAGGLLRDVRARGLSCLVVSNFDARVRGILEGLEIAPLIDRVTISSEAGAAKPDPAIFAVALADAGLAPQDVLHVGDTAREDWDGGRAAGLRVVLVGGPELHAEAPEATVVPRLADVATFLP